MVSPQHRRVVGAYTVLRLYQFFLFMWLRSISGFKPSFDLVNVDCGSCSVWMWKFVMLFELGTWSCCCYSNLPGTCNELSALDTVYNSEQLGVSLSEFPSIGGSMSRALLQPANLLAHVYQKDALANFGPWIAFQTICTDGNAVCLCYCLVRHS